MGLTYNDIVQSAYSRYGIPPGGKHFFVQPSVGSDGNAGTKLSAPLDTVSKALSLCTTGNNDVVHLLADGGTTGTSREASAIAWSLSATHLIGHTAGVPTGSRARIAPPTTTVGAAGNKSYVTVSGSGCIVANVQIWAGFATGIAATIALIVSGSRNAFYNVHAAGHADAVSAADADSYSLKLFGSENLFLDCTIGVDTVLRNTATNANVWFGGNAARNRFNDCDFPVWTSNTASLIGTVPAANPNGTDRYTLFTNCRFMNAQFITSAATMAAAFTAVSNAINGYFLLKDCARVNITDWGTDATTNARIYLSGSGDEAQAGDEVGRAHIAIAS